MARLLDPHGSNPQLVRSKGQSELGNGQGMRASIMDETGRRRQTYQ